MKVTESCKGCWRWKIFKTECHYHWDLKKTCSQYESEGDKKDKENAMQIK